MPRGEIRTPAFIPVGAAAMVTAMKLADLHASEADIDLPNMLLFDRRVETPKQLDPSTDLTMPALPRASGGRYRAPKNATET